MSAAAPELVAAPGRPARLAAHPPRAVLVVKLSSIGDVVHSLFALPALRQAYPAARLGWVAARGCHELLEGHPLLDRLHVFERQAWGRRLGWLRHRRAILEFLAGIRRERYDLVVDLQGLARSALITACSGARWRAGFASAREGAPLAYNLRHAVRRPWPHAVERYRGLLASVGAPWPPPDQPSLSGADFETAASAAAAEALLEGVPAGARVALLPWARWPTKRWAPERFAELAVRLSTAGAQVLLLGAPGEAEAIRAIAATAPGVRDLSGRVPLGHLAAVLRRVDLLVTGDSGPMHLAAAVGTPTLALFGPTDPGRTGPYGAGHRVLRLELECSPCLSRRCRLGDRRCLERLPVPEVERAALEMLQGGHKA